MTSSAANPTPTAIYLRRPNTVVAPPPEIMFLRRFYRFNRANGSDKIEEAASPTPAAIYLRRPDIVVAPPPEIMFLRRFYGVNSANGSDKIKEAIVVVKDLGGSIVEVDDVVSEDGEAIDGVKVSKGEDLGKSDDVASRDGEGGAEIENEGEVKVSESEIGGSNGGEVKASESEMGVNGGTVNKVILEKKQVEISTKVSLPIGVSGLTPSLLLDFLLRTFENLIATEWFVVFNNFGSTLFTVFVGFFRAIWTLANALEYGREDLRKLLDGVNVKRIILPNGVKFENHKRLTSPDL
ncbi:hypothetical protein Tco_0878885 [Tanacetum coccineum]|uniref:Uncharacterized protein n=1 Tax=Tanacetum coccineum TaxID=301880 RepID=A0ABQ5C0Y4_9ASTR